MAICLLCYQGLTRTRRTLFKILRTFLSLVTSRGLFCFPTLIHYRGANRYWTNRSVSSSMNASRSASARG